VGLSIFGFDIRGRTPEALHLRQGRARPAPSPRQGLTRPRPWPTMAYKAP